jgi:hypothetical protein
MSTENDSHLSSDRNERRCQMCRGRHGDAHETPGGVVHRYILEFAGSVAEGARG